MEVNHKSSPRRKGFLLMEALLALSIFGIAVTSIVIAIHQASKVSTEINRQAWAQAQLKNLMSEVLTIPVSEGEFQRDEIRELPDTNTNTKARIQIIPSLALVNTNDTTSKILNKMYQVTITLYWDEDGNEKYQSASVIHYYPLHQKR